MIRLISTKFRRRFLTDKIFFYDKGFKSKHLRFKVIEAKVFGLKWIVLKEYHYFLNLDKSDDAGGEMKP